jgi:predicted nucleic acid-binding protein
MPINIAADIIDITTDTPLETDKFFVDSNVWYWVGYTNASVTARHNQSTDYPNYLSQCLLNAANLLKCALSFPELAHIIERTEREIFEQINQTTISPKNFRHNYPTERQQVVTEIQNVWALIELMTNNQTIPLNVDDQAVSAALTSLTSLALDGYDLFMLDAILQAGITQVITDDSDFGQVSGIQVFTSNQRLIQTAKTQGQLVKR